MIYLSTQNYWPEYDISDTCRIDLSLVVGQRRMFQGTAISLINLHIQATILVFDRQGSY